MMERACEVELISRHLGEEPVMIDEYIVQQTRQRAPKAQRCLAGIRRVRLAGRTSPDRRQGQRLAAVEAAPAV